MSGSEIKESAFENEALSLSVISSHGEAKAEEADVLRAEILFPLPCKNFGSWNCYLAGGGVNLEELIRFSCVHFLGPQICTPND